MNKASCKLLKRRHKERGVVLITALLVMAVMLIISVPFLFKLSGQYRATDKSFKSLASLSLAEAGVERAIWELNYGDISSWNGDNDLRTMTISSFQAAGGTAVGDMEISVTDPEGSNPIVEATGKIPFTGNLTVDKTVKVVLERNAPSLFDYGIFGGDGLEMHGNAMIDSYDSSLGDYGELIGEEENKGSNGHIATNSTAVGCISLYNNAEIFGNATSGPESVPEDVIVTENNSVIYGQKSSLDDLKTLPSIPAPVGLPSMGGLELDSNDEITINTSGEYSSIELDSNSKITITADVTLYITGEFVMDNNSQLEVADGVTLTVYLGGTFTQDSNSAFNNLSEDPTSLMILGTDSFNGTMGWNSNSDFWGAIYVPRAAMNIYSNAMFYGSVVARYINMDSNGQIHYDEALEDVDTSGFQGDNSYRVKSWQEKIN